MLVQFQLLHCSCAFFVTIIGKIIINIVKSKKMYIIIPSDGKFRQHEVTEKYESVLNISYVEFFVL